MTKIMKKKMKDDKSIRLYENHDYECKFAPPFTHILTIFKRFYPRWNHSQSSESALFVLVRKDAIPSLSTERYSLEIYRFTHEIYLYIYF